MSGISAVQKKSVQERMTIVVDNEFMNDPMVRLEYVPSENDSELVFVNGLTQDPSGYVLNGDTLSFFEEMNLKVGDNIFIKYWRYA